MGCSTSSPVAPVPAYAGTREQHAIEYTASRQSEKLLNSSSALGESSQSPLVRDPKGTSTRKATLERNPVDCRTLLAERSDVHVTARYQVGERLGKGACGKVYSAVDRRCASRRVAVKQVEKTSQEIYELEARVMKELDHPNICRLLETFEHGKHFFLVTEHLEGGDVADRITYDGLIEEQHAAEITAQVAKALSYAHSYGIAHRDIKPQNVCFVSDETHDTDVKVIDWGSCGRFREALMSSRVGTPSYAAPEVLTAGDNDEYSSACDLWSLGAFAYTMLCGRLPFRGTEAERLAAMRGQEYRVSGGQWDSVSQDGVDFVHTLLRPVPEARLPIQKVLQHPWLQQTVRVADPGTLLSALTNLQAFSGTSLRGALCRASVARQLDHTELRDIRSAFDQLDSDGDGVLSLEELREGLREAFGEGSAEFAQAKELFKRCDLDRSGAIEFTEFAALGMGDRLIASEGAVWAAFKAFDHQDSGRIGEAELLRFMDLGGAQRVLGCDGGTLNFKAWKEHVRHSSSGRGKFLKGVTALWADISHRSGGKE